MSTTLTIVGAGNMGRGIAHVAARGGHPITIVDRDPQEAANLVRELREAHPSVTATSASLDQGLDSDVIVLAVWYTAAQEIAKQHRDRLDGKIVVDIANPINDTFDGLAIAGTTSAAEELARLVPNSRVVKAFNTTFAGTLVEGEVAGVPLDVLVAGDDADAKGIVAEIAGAGGLRSIDVGPLERSRQLEGLGFLGIGLQGPQGTNFASAWKFLA